MRVLFESRSLWSFSCDDWLPRETTSPPCQLGTCFRSFSAAKRYIVPEGVVHAGGGIGGGGVLVPLYILCLGFQTEHAVALSNLTIAGGSFANLFINVFRCVPLATDSLFLCTGF
jgi:uncharacterized membrane protein YfcA